MSTDIVVKPFLCGSRVAILRARYRWAEAADQDRRIRSAPTCRPKCPKPALHRVPYALPTAKSQALLSPHTRRQGRRFLYFLVQRAVLASYTCDPAQSYRSVTLCYLLVLPAQCHIMSRPKRSWKVLLGLLSVLTFTGTRSFVQRLSPFPTISLTSNISSRGQTL